MGIDMTAFQKRERESPLPLHNAANYVKIKEKLNKVLPGFQAPRCNNKIKLDQPKAVDTVDVEDLGSKGVFCRCWKSNKFPYCDGSHVKHNAETGDNVGPLIIKKSD